MAYNSTYAEGDIATASLDGIIKVILTVGSLITIVVLIAMYTYFKKKVKP